jgi:hypothetical protein
MPDPLAPTEPAPGTLVRPQVSPAPLDLDKKAITENWKKTWENYLITGLDKETDKYKIALLQHSIEQDAFKKFATGKDPNIHVGVFEAHFFGLTKEYFECIQFNCRNKNA